MALNINDFKAQIVGGGARPNLFKVIIPTPPFAGGNIEKMSFLIQAAQLPASNMGVIQQPFRGRQLKLAGDRTFDEWQVNMLNDTDFDGRDSMERWMDAVNAHTENTGLTRPGSYEVDAQVIQLDRDENHLKTYTFVGLFPSQVGDIALSYGDNDRIEDFNVVFQYQYWTSNTTT